MRDYGTGQWEGGEAGCSHEVGRFTYAHSEKQGSNSGSAGHKAHGVCPHCGARRIDRQIGREASPDEYVAQMVAVFREVWRVLRSDGCVFLNLGDSYASQGGPNTSHKNTGQQSVLDGGAYHLQSSIAPAGLKPKDLVGIPWRVAFALQADGWWLRSDIVWHKPNPMPESVTDRPTKSHEYIFLLSKSRRYYYDQEAVREASSWDPAKTKMPDGWDTGVGGHGTIHRNGREKGRPNSASVSAGRNRRSVWTVTTKPYKGAHFATFPPDLVEPMVLAGTSAKGCCPECGKPWERVVEKKTVRQQADDAGTWVERPGAVGYGRAAMTTQRIDKTSGLSASNSHNAGTPQSPIVTTTGWRPGCDCYDDDYRRDFPQARSARKRHQRDVTGDWWRRVRKRPGKAGWTIEACNVLDCFGGTMTVGEVCAKHGRHFIGLDLKREYVEMGRERCANVQTAMPL